MANHLIYNNKVMISEIDLSNFLGVSEETAKSFMEGRRYRLSKEDTTLEHGLSWDEVERFIGERKLSDFINN